VPGRKHTGHSKQDRLESKGSAWEETQGVVYSTDGSVMVVPGGNTQGIVNMTGWRVSVVPGRKLTGHSKQDRLDSKGSAWRKHRA
jgi:hypothetical protein